MVRLKVPMEVIEKAVDDYLKNTFGRSVMWSDSYLDYQIKVHEFEDPPFEIDFTKFELEDEW